MAVVAAVQTTESEAWFASWFDSPHYHRLYAHRNELEAAAFVDALLGRLQPPRQSSMLDLGCGAGRHARYLASKGFQVDGLDLAASSIRQARCFEQPGLRFRRHDMREPFGVSEYDYVFSFFTSFGYFDDAADHLAVVRNIASALRPGGRLVLDYLNANHAAAHLKPEEVVSADGTTYRVSRWSDADAVFKRVAIEEAGKESRSFTERVARFGRPEFDVMFQLYGLRVEEVYGDYQLGAYDAKSSPRLILVAAKPPRERCFRTRLSVSGEIPR